MPHVEGRDTGTTDAVRGVRDMCYRLNLHFQVCSWETSGIANADHLFNTSIAASSTGDGGCGTKVWSRVDIKTDQTNVEVSLVGIDGCPLSGSDCRPPSCGSKVVGNLTMDYDSTVVAGGKRAVQCWEGDSRGGNKDEFVWNTVAEKSAYGGSTRGSVSGEN